MSERNVASIVKPAIADWQSVIVSPTHVNLPYRRPIKLSDYFDSIDQTGSFVTPEDKAILQESATSKTLAWEKSIETIEQSGLPANHSMIVEMGMKFLDLETLTEEYYIIYDYVTEDNKTIEVGIQVHLHNRDAQGNVVPNVLGVNIQTKNPSLPPVLETAPDDGKHPRLLQVTQADYDFNADGIYESLVFTGKDGEWKEVSANTIGVLKHRPEFLTQFPTGVDVLHQKLDGLTTLQNLFDNINSLNPVNPLTLLAFFPLE